MVNSLKILLAAVVFSYLVWYLDPAMLWEAIAQVEGGRLLICGVLALLGIGVQWLKWQYLARSILPNISWSDSLYSLLGGAALGFVTPGRLGEMGRGVFLQGGRAHLMLLTAADKLSSVVVTLSLGWLAAWLLWPGFRIGLILVLIPIGLGVWWGRARWGGHLKVVRNVSGWGNIVGLSLLFNLLFMSQFYWLVRSGLAVDHIIVLAIPVVFAIKALLPVGFLDIGIREAAAVFVFSALGLEVQSAFVASIILFACNICLPAAVGWAWIGGRKAGVGKRFELTRKVAL